MYHFFCDKRGCPKDMGFNPQSDTKSYIVDPIQLQGGSLYNFLHFPSHRNPLQNAMGFLRVFKRVLKK